MEAVPHTSFIPIQRTLSSISSEQIFFSLIHSKLSIIPRMGPHLLLSSKILSCAAQSFGLNK